MTIPSIKPAIAAIQAHAVTAGVKEAPSLPIASAAVFPFSVCYLASGTIAGSTGTGEKDLITLNLDVHTNEQDLPTDVNAMVTLFEALRQLLVADPTLGGTVSTMQLQDDRPIQWNFGHMKYGSVETVGFRFTIVVKQRS